jgi:hypothetical protein
MFLSGAKPQPKELTTDFTDFTDKEDFSTQSLQVAKTQRVGAATKALSLN